MDQVFDRGTIRIVRVRRPETVAGPRIKQLILEAVERTRYPGTTPENFYAEMAANVSRETLGLFIGFESDVPKAAALASLPTSAASLAPQCFLVYSAGKPQLIRRMGERLRVWIMAAGYDRVIGINLWRDDKVFCRGLAHMGEPKVIGSLVEFKFPCLG